VEADERCAVHRLHALCHVGHGLAAGIEFLQTGLRISRHAVVGDLYADLRRIGDGRVECVEGQNVNAAERDCLVTSADGNRADRRIERLRFGFKRHCVFLLKWLIGKPGRTAGPPLVLR